MDETCMIYGPIKDVLIIFAKKNKLRILSQYDVKLF